MKKLICAFLLTIIWGTTITVQAAGYNDVDENGGRIFSAVPPVGVHPRVIMSPQDLAAWRENVIKTYRGKKFFAKRFEAKKTIDVLAALDPNLADEELVKAYPNADAGSNHDLLYATMDVIYHQDKIKAEKVCRAMTNFGRVVLARSKYDPEWGKIKDDIGGIKGNSGIPTGLGELWRRGGADFALAYDYLFDYMTKEQQDICRQALSEATKDLVTWGMNFPRGRGISNWYGYHGELGPMLLAIEGEEGYRADQWKKFSEMIRNWAEVHIYENGGSNEDGYTINTSLREGQFTLIAMARRGENHYTRPNIRNYFKWLALSLVPGAEGGTTVEYSSSSAGPYESAPVLARWAMPGDKLVNYYLYKYKGKDYQLQDRWQYADWSTLLCMNYEENEKMPLEMAKLGLPITHVFPYQGLFITRSDWSDDASYLNILARQDAWYDRHENVDRGRFVFAALGREWATDRPWGQATQSQDHSLVHIDGLAQAETKVGRGKAPNARLMSYGDLDETGKKLDEDETAKFGALSYAVLDLSNAYNWLWSHSWEKPGDGWEPETRSFAEIGWPWKRPGQPEKLHGSDNKDVPAFNFEGLNLWRKPYNPVEFCWRSAFMVRGKNPYTVIVDEVKKDTQPRVYDWYMPIPDDVEFSLQENGAILLTEKGEKREANRAAIGSRRLLIVPLQPSKAAIKVEDYTASIAKGKTNTARRLIVSHKGTEGVFKMLFYPFRTTQAPEGNDWKQHPLGALMPEFGTEKGGFFVKLAGRTDHLLFAPAKDGRSRITLRRDGKNWDIQ